MKQATDVRGIPWTVGSDRSAEPLFTAIEQYFMFSDKTMTSLDALLAGDPDCPGAWVLKGYLFLFARSASLKVNALEAHACASGLASRATARERLHIRALKAWAEGDWL
ncbi:MAG: hypothetical protein GY798_18775, partial [Hyphomicrobiales bacterium]|nr:hypothetical protein [Hyphomicrobiales bacterium]